MKDDLHGAGVKFPPPLILLTNLLVGVGATMLWPIGMGLSEVLEIPGIVIGSSGILLVVVSAFSFRKARTHIEPWKPTSSIIDTGLFAYSRNPIYLGMCLIPCGVGIRTDSLWILLSSLTTGIAIHHFAIRREEAYLEDKFGEEYLQYKRRVRRWL